VKAGYTETSARNEGYRLMRTDAIVNRINELHAHHLKANQVTEASVFANIRHDRDLARASGQYAVAAKLDELEGRYLTMFSDSSGQGGDRSLVINVINSGKEPTKLVESAVVPVGQIAQRRALEPVNEGEGDSGDA
jgi:hypothetical protein